MKLQQQPAHHESGQVTAEYAVGTLGAVGIAALLVSPPWWLLRSGLGRWLCDRFGELPFAEASGPLSDAIRWPW